MEVNARQKDKFSSDIRDLSSLEMSDQIRYCMIEFCGIPRLPLLSTLALHCCFIFCLLHIHLLWERTHRYHHVKNLNNLRFNLFEIVCTSYSVSDPRGLEVRGHGGRPSPAVAFLPRHHHRHRRHPHGRPPHLWVCRPGQDHRHLQGKVKSAVLPKKVAKVKEVEARSCHLCEFRKSF